MSNSAEALAAAPLTVELVDAAALPPSGLAAWQTLFELAELRPGQTVLINGAGGAVGGVAVQLAVDAGASVTAADDAQHADRLTGYGAHRVVGRLDLAAGPDAVGGPCEVVLNHVRVSRTTLLRCPASSPTAGSPPAPPARYPRLPLVPYAARACGSAATPRS